MLTYDGYGRVYTVAVDEGPNAGDIYALTSTTPLDRVAKVTYPDATYEQVVYSRLDAAKFRDRLGRLKKNLHPCTH